MTEQHLVISQIQSKLGPGTTWQPDQGTAATVWPLQSFDLVWIPERRRDSDLRTVWHARSKGGAQPVIVISTSEQPDKVRVLGPQDPQTPVRTIPLETMLELIEEYRALPRRQAAAVLASEFLRLDESGIPGVGLRGLLTKHFVQERLRRPENWAFLTSSSTSVSPKRGWQENIKSLGYQLETTSTGYLLRYKEEPVAVLHAYSDPSMFSHASDQGTLPEGAVLAECEHYGTSWGILATPQRFRLFRNNPPVGAASGRYLEIDIKRLGTEDIGYAGLLAPDSLKREGQLHKWIKESLDYGEQLREGIERRLRDEALPNIARGLGEWLHSQEGADLSKPELLRDIESAALTFVFRFIFILYAEAAAFLPVDSAAYKPYGATELAASARRDLARLDRRSTQFWDRLTTLVRMVRTGNKATGVSAYNGSLFAASGFPGSELLERAQITDNFVAPALAVIAYATDEPDSPGLDYAGLEIGHLGAIYEGLLGLKLTSAMENLKYDTRTDRYLPAHAGEAIEVQQYQLFYQTESGGRKAAGVYYTRHEFVRHLIKYSLEPALDEHLKQIAEIASTDPIKAAYRMLDFNVVDPAMGSAHFLTAALDVMADRIVLFLAEHPLPAIRQLLDSLKGDSEGGTGRIYEDSQLLRRLILKRCIYGVDLSPMAVEVANISLWLTSFVPGLSLSYLGSNLKVGDALIGIADMNALYASNPLFGANNPGSPITLAFQRAKDIAKALSEVGDRTPEEVTISREKERELQQSTEGIARCLNLWCAEPLGVIGARHPLETGDIQKIIDGDFNGGTTRLVKAANQEAERRRFLHWPLVFPNVFMRDNPGFDVVIGNPPWNELTIEKLGFYALYNPGLRGITHEANRQARIQELDRLYPEIKREFEQRSSDLASQRQFFGPIGGYILQGAGDPDLYKLFCERYGHLTREKGYLGVVLPRSAFLVDGARGFRRWLFKDCTVKRIDFLLNSGRWAFNMEPRYTISLVSSERVKAADAEMHQTGPSTSLEEFLKASQSPGVGVPLTTLREWTPSPADDPIKEPSWEVPLLPSKAAANVFAKLRKGPRFDYGYPNIWKVIPIAELHETHNKKLFSHKQGLPVWKGRSFDQYAPHGEEPAGYARLSELEIYLQQKRQSTRSQFRRYFSSIVLKDKKTLPLHNARIAFRDVTNRTNARTVIACLIPPETGLTNKAPYLVFSSGTIVAQMFVLGLMNSLPFDWQARRIVETNVNFFILDMLCFPTVENTPWERIGKLAARLSCVDERFTEFAKASGVEIGPLKENRDSVRAEIDALVARAYGLDETDLYTIFSDFTERAVATAYRERVLEKFRKEAR
ncbi:MAG: hypothetical protein ABR886_01085 [Dehalococcoidales bacterium]